MLTAFINARIYTGEEEISGQALLIENDKIKAILSPAEIPAGARIIDLPGLNIAPGLIDLQIYGSGGQLFGGKPTVEALRQMETDLLSQGCTGFLATVATNSPEIVEQAIAAAKAFRNESMGIFLGLHLEGPYLNPKRRGAHPEKFIKKATLAEVKHWVESAEGEIKMITIAPELQDQEVIDYISSQNIVISAGHSDASYAQASSFFQQGVSAATHLFNAMPSIHHRDPGLVTAILNQKPYTSIVADGIHVDFAVIKMAKEILGDKLFLITDAVTETKEGVYQHVFNTDRYTMPDGTLSGSCLSMWQAVKNCVDFAGISLAEAIRMASLYPARLIGHQQHRGLIKPDMQANLIIFNDELKIEKTCFRGVLA